MVALTLAAPFRLCCQPSIEQITFTFEQNARAATAAAGITRADAKWRIQPGVHVGAGALIGPAGVVLAPLLQLDFIETSGWTMQAGRQRLSFGDERLISSDSEAGLSPRFFDGVSGAWQRGRVRLDAFSTTAVSGLHTSVTLFGNASVQPYVYRTATTIARGVLCSVPLGAYTLASEMTHEGSGRWAGSWTVARELGKSVASFETNYATPGFDELYPATLNGLAGEDPYPWSDTRNFAATWDRKWHEHWASSVSYREYWNASGSHMGHHTTASVRYEGKHWYGVAGYGHLIARADGGMKPFFAVGWRH